MSKIIPISFKIEYIGGKYIPSIYADNNFRIIISYVNKNNPLNIKVKGKIITLSRDNIKYFKRNYHNYDINFKATVYKRVGNFIVKFLLISTNIIEPEYKFSPISINKVTLGGLIKLWIFKKRQR